LQKPDAYEAALLIVVEDLLKEMSSEEVEQKVQEFEDLVGEGGEFLLSSFLFKYW